MNHEDGERVAIVSALALTKKIFNSIISMPNATVGMLNDTALIAGILLILTKHYGIEDSIVANIESIRKYVDDNSEAFERLVMGAVSGNGDNSGQDIFKDFIDGLDI